MIHVSLATAEDRSAWEGYVSSTGLNHHSFRWAWRDILEQAFLHKCYYFIARRSGSSSDSDNPGEVSGILPLVYVKSFLFGRALVSLPYLNGGGISADSKESYDALLQEATSLASELGVKYLELRHREDTDWTPPHLAHRAHKVSMILQLDCPAEDLFSSFKPKLRSQIRRPSKSGMFARVASLSSLDAGALDGFYSVFAANMRDLGTPVYPKRLFLLTAHAFRDSCRIITVWHEKNPVAAGITIGSGDSVEIPWASSLRKYSQQAPNMLLYWQAIKTACEDGYRHFDFGRSSVDSGTFRFKEQWGAQPKQLHWYYDVYKDDIPDVNPKSSKYSVLVKGWQQLPLPIANFLGPWITKSLP